MFEEYVKQIGLENLIKHIQDVQLNNFVTEAFSTNPPTLSAEEVKDLYEYVVPKISADGSCSIIDTPAEKPYNLAETYRLPFATIFLHPEFISGSPNEIKEMLNQVQHDKNTIRLWRLKQIVEKIVDKTNVDWFGIYRKLQNVHNDCVLAKESYKGLFSRPEFPLTEDFAKKSNNSTVGLTGKAKVIQDVYNSSGPYYKCDGKVQSEFCVPILSPFVVARSEATKQPQKEHKRSPRFARDDDRIIGIVDAEAFPKEFFTNERLLQIAKVAFDLGQIDLGI